MTSPSNSKTQQLAVLVLSVALTTFIAGGAVSYWVFSKSEPAGGQLADAKGKPKSQGGNPSMLVRVGQVKYETVSPIRSLVGDLISVRSATVATEVPGKLEKIFVDEGSQVIGGKTLLARIDGTWVDLERKRVEAQIQSSQAMLDFEQADLKRIEDLLSSQATSVSEVEQKKATVDQLVATLAELKVQLEELKVRQKRLDIYAPFNGTVVSKWTEQGEYLAIGSPVVDLVSSGRIDVRTMVPEDCLSYIDLGATIEITVPGQQLDLVGKVASINAKGSVASRTFAVRVAVDDQEGKLLPGMGARVYVPSAKTSTQLMVPRDAVLTKPDESTVWLLQPLESGGGATEGELTHFATPVPVRVLSHTRDSYAIECVRESDANLVKDGSLVVVEGLERLIPGITVRIDADRKPLSPVPGTYRDGQQKLTRSGIGS